MKSNIPKKKITERVKGKLPRLPSRKPKDASLRLDEAIQTLPRITNDTIAEHREEVIGSARKYIYPLRHPKKRVLTITISLLIAFVLTFLTYTLLALYHFQSSSAFLYRVTQVVPFPAAKVGSSWVSYENYLFELRHYQHYYETQQKIDFKTAAGQQQLTNYKKQALQQVVDAALVKQLATEHNVTVSDREVGDAITLVRNQNHLGNNEKVFREVLNEFWGWSVDDFKRELKQQLLAQKVVATLDTTTQQRAHTALSQLQGGADFAAVAKQYSDDPATKDNGGQFGTLIARSNQSIPPQTLNKLFSLQPGQTSDIVNIGYALEIDKVQSVQGNQVQAAHILFNFKPISTYLNPLKAKEKPHYYIKIRS